MRDMVFRFLPDGQKIPVAQIPTATIEFVLGNQDLISLSECDDPGMTVEDTVERLKIELVIRSLGLSSV